MAKASATAGLNQIRILDDFILAAVAGQECEVAAWIAERQEAVQQTLRDAPSLACLEELGDRTRRLEDRFLHLRRTSIMELSLIEQHLRFLSEQRHDTPARLNVSA